MSKNNITVTFEVIFKFNESITIETDTEEEIVDIAKDEIIKKYQKKLGDTFCKNMKVYGRTVKGHTKDKIINLYKDYCRGESYWCDAEKEKEFLPFL